MQYVNRSNTSNNNNTVILQLISSILKLATTVLQLIKQKIVKKISLKNIYCI